MEAGLITHLEVKDKIILPMQNELDDFEKKKEKEGKEKESVIIMRGGDEKMKSKLKVVSKAYEDIWKKYNDVMTSSGSSSNGDNNCMLE